MYSHTTDALINVAMIPQVVHDIIKTYKLRYLTHSIHYSFNCTVLLLPCYPPSYPGYPASLKAQLRD